MSDNKIRIYNRTQFNIGIKTPTNDIGINIRPGSFTLLSEEEIDYVMSTSTLLQSGWLQVEEKAKEETLAKMGIDEKEAAAFMDDEEIKKKLNGNAKSIEKWLATVEDPIEIDRITNIAVSMNLSISKMKLIQSKNPHRDLMEE